MRLEILSYTVKQKITKTNLIDSHIDCTTMGLVYRIFFHFVDYHFVTLNSPFLAFFKVFFANVGTESFKSFSFRRSMLTVKNKITNTNLI